MRVLKGSICFLLVLCSLAAGGPNYQYWPLSNTHNAAPTEKEVVFNEQNINPWKIVWNDEFNGSDLNSAYWNILSTPSIDGNRIQDYNLENVEVSDGKLIIRTDEETSQGMPYTSGAVTTKGKALMKYGKIEVRAKLPAGTGILPAIWLWNDAGNPFPEIDIVETLGGEPGKLWSNIHYEVNGIYGRDYNLAILQDLTLDYHTYGIEWYTDKITFFFDGTPIFTSTEYMPDEDMYLFINTDVGGNWGGDPDDTTVFPAEMLVDWVRYYQK